MLNPQREYEAPKIETPRGNANEVDLIAATSAMRIFSMKTRWPLESVLTPGVFDGMIDLRFKRDDRIELISNCHADRSEHATLIVDDADKHGKARVSLLHL